MTHIKRILCATLFESSLVAVTKNKYGLVPSISAMVKHPVMFQPSTQITWEVNPKIVWDDINFFSGLVAFNSRNWEFRVDMFQIIRVVILLYFCFKVLIYI